MLTIDIRLNGQIIATAGITNVSDLADVSDYQLRWSENGNPELGIARLQGLAAIKGHRRRQSVWALVAKATVAILDQLAGDPSDIR